MGCHVDQPENDDDVNRDTMLVMDYTDCTTRRLAAPRAISTSAAGALIGACQIRMATRPGASPTRTHGRAPWMIARKLYPAREGGLVQQSRTVVCVHLSAQEATTPTIL